VGPIAGAPLGALTGFPFGSYRYSDLFGPSLGIVPLTIPLAWHVVLTNALFLVRSVAPHRSRPVEAALTGLLCTLYDFVLEPFATSVKGYWQWSGGTVPLQNYAAWFAVSALLVGGFAPASVARFRNDIRPWVVLGATLIIFLAGRFCGGR
jgi:putative membrane protein